MNTDHCIPFSTNITIKNIQAKKILTSEFKLATTHYQIGIKKKTAIKVVSILLTICNTLLFRNTLLTSNCTVLHFFSFLLRKIKLPLH